MSQEDMALWKDILRKNYLDDTKALANMKGVDIRAQGGLLQIGKFLFLREQRNY